MFLYFSSFSNEFQKYLVVLDSDHILNLPKKYWSVEEYNATLGHFVNHSFKKPNARIDHATHPRFGPIRSIVALRKIMVGEEILCNYGYMENSVVPTWYAKEYKKYHKKKWPKDLIYNDDNGSDKI